MILNKIINEDINEILINFNHFEKFKNKTILISGAAGFLPAYLVETFLSLDPIFNTRVIALVRSFEKAKDRFSDWNNDSRLKLIQHDVTYPYICDEKIDFIIHAASQASPKYFGLDPVGTLNANILGTINLLNLAIEHEVESFLYFSSGEVYGEVNNKEIPIKEDSFGYLNPTKVRACYGESKRMGENICVSYHSQFGVKAKIVRPFHTYGPGMSLTDGRVFADFVSNVVNKQNIIMKSDGSAIRAFCYLTDATLGFLNIILKGEDGQAYNMGNPNQEHSILELAQIIAEIYPDFKIKVIKKQHQQADNKYLKSPILRNTPNIEKIMKLGWIPKVGTSEGFKRTIDSFLE
jgi:nucleoside-diphosphate-sugar epimerase